jgi:hypothetical protein
MPMSYRFYYNNDQQQTSFKILKQLVEKRTNFLISPLFDEFQCDVYVLLDNPHSNIVAIDWDNTFTVDPAFYNELILAYLRCGFKPIICTLRGTDKEDVHDICAAIDTEKVRIFPTNGHLKQQYMQKYQQLSINLWIDDFFPGIAPCNQKLIMSNGIEI